MLSVCVTNLVMEESAADNRANPSLRRTFIQPNTGTGVSNIMKNMGLIPQPDAGSWEQTLKLEESSGVGLSAPNRFYTHMGAAVVWGMLFPGDK